MSTSLTVLPEDTFTFGDIPVRTIIRDGEPWFVAADVADVLGYTRTSNAMRHVDPEDYLVLSSDNVSPGQPEYSLLQLSGVGNLRTTLALVNESGLYALILRSNRPEAQAFKRWVTAEVLPAIRRTGGYGLAVPTTLPEALELAAAQARQLDTARAELAAAEPKVAAFDTYHDADGAVSMGTAANMLGVGRTTLFMLLRRAGILQHQDNRPYQRYAQHFKVIARTHSHPAYGDRAGYTTRVRPSGIELIRRVLADTPSPALPPRL